MKKLLAILLAVALMVTMSVTTFAMQIFIEITVATGNEYITLEVEETDRIEDVKAKIFEKNGTPISLQVLTHAGRTLEDGNTLQDYSIQNDSTIHLSALASTTVTYSVNPGYTVTIPTDVTIDGNSTTISAENVVVEKGKYVSVTLADDNDFTVKTAQGAELDYTVTANGANVAAGGEILAVNPTDGKTGSATVTFAVDESAIKYAGTYTGTAIFTVAVKDVPKTIINFTMDSSDFEGWIPGLTKNLQAEAGMTWGEWLASDYNVDGYVMSEYRDGIYYIHPAGEDWVAVRDTQFNGFDEPTDEIIADNTYTLLQIWG